MAFHQAEQGVRASTRPVGCQKPLRQQRQGLNVPRSHHREVSAVKGGHLRLAMSFSQRDYERIGRAQRQVGVLLDELRHPQQVDAIR